ncbi:TIGR03032 family protein [Actibacterium sp. 188UL27-1]|uniref:TIGR03032 family protein n=1 Tax=Actibacterium sp. 188UL27-1 TaxID=2786961 RepID=UPI001956E9E7|nr:TIGR03032 family protein [Actibacterium sp. 188UL27-1]MBM7066192.1 TIGR03032 family protein [Actibacterium sp. 188UL27-1]
MSSASETTTPDVAQETKFSASGGFVSRLAALGCAVGFTSYQSGLLYLAGRTDRGLHIHQSAMPRPMGLRYDAKDGRLVLSAGGQILRFENVLRPGERANQIFDACFAPRIIHITGRLEGHDVGIGADGTPIFVNTRFNCLATVDPRDSFRAIWQPPFIDVIIDEDRCHLNGLAMREGQPAYATAVSRSNTIDGWRDRRADGGVVIDVATGQIVCEGLSMPHSPRLHNGILYVLNAGTGEFGRVALPDGTDGPGQFEPIAFCPGFLRGLSFAGDFAFVGLSKPRYNRFEGLALDDRLHAADSEAWCGVQVIDLTSGACLDWLRLDGPVAEIYDVEVFPGLTCPMAVSPNAPELPNLITHQDRAKAPPTEPSKI